MLLVFSEKNVLVESSVEQYDNEKYQSGAAPHTNVGTYFYNRSNR